MSKTEAFLSTLQQANPQCEIDPFIIDFCHIWYVIQQLVKNERVRKITKTAELAFTLKEKYTLPFLEKYQHYAFVECFPGWLERLATIFLQYKGGRITFPLRLITYELAHHQDYLLDQYIDNLLAKKIQGTREMLFEFLFPKLTRMALPLSASDLIMLKSFQTVQNHCQDIHKGPTTKDFANHIPTLTAETIRNKLEQLVFLQIVSKVHFLDMGKLGYETYLITHTSPLPASYENYCLFSVNFSHFSQKYLSVLQLPYSNPHLLMQIKETLGSESSYLPLTRRIHTWNLANLNKGTNNWTLPCSFFYGDAYSTPATPSATLDLSLDPKFDRYRPLNPADIELLTFLTTVAKPIRINDLSTQLNLHRHTVTNLLKEYQKAKLLHKVVQYSNVGLDLPIYFFLKIPTQEFPFLAQSQTLPRVDVFLSETPEATVYFGRVDITQRWMREFAARMKYLRDSFPEMTLLYTAEPPLQAKWNLSLKTSLAD